MHCEQQFSLPSPVLDSTRPDSTAAAAQTANCRYFSNDHDYLQCHLGVCMLVSPDTAPLKVFVFSLRRPRLALRHPFPSYCCCCCFCFCCCCSGVNSSPKRRSVVTGQAPVILSQVYSSSSKSDATLAHRQNPDRSDKTGSDNYVASQCLMKPVKSRTQFSLRCTIT